MLSIIVDSWLPESPFLAYYSPVIGTFRVNTPMRLEVFCEDRLGLTRELLDLLVLRGIDLRGIDIRCV